MNVNPTLLYTGERLNESGSGQAESDLQGTHQSQELHEDTSQNTDSYVDEKLAELVDAVHDKPVASPSPTSDSVIGSTLTLAERDHLLLNFVKGTLETNFDQNIWLVKRTYWAYASRRLGKHFITTRLSHWIFEFIAEERLHYDMSKKIVTDLDKARRWVNDYVKVKNTHHKVPIFRYIRMIQPKLQSEGGNGCTEQVMKTLGLQSVEQLYWDPVDLEKQAVEDRDYEIFQQKQRQLAKQQLGESPDEADVKRKRNRKKRSDDEDDMRKKGRRKDELGTDIQSTFPPFEVWEDDDSFLVALQVPAIDRTTLNHKISIVGLEVSGSCSLPIAISKKWPGAFDWYPRKWTRSIEFPRPIDPTASGLVDIHCEGMLFYKCPKQQIQTEPLTNTIKLQEG